MPSNHKDYQDITEKLSKQRGFTLMELMVTVSIAGIMMGIAIPSFTSTIKNSRITAQVNEFTTSLNLSRSEAVKRGVRITLCKSSNGTTCVADGATTNWSQGWIVFSDENSNNAYNSATETLLRVQGAAQGNVTIIGDTDVDDSISYLSGGQVDKTGIVTICDDRVSEMGKSITINATGRSKIDPNQCA
jgi:type IV fimbrial biogenesis protein FimT